MDVGSVEGGRNGASKVIKVGDGEGHGDLPVQGGTIYEKEIGGDGGAQGPPAEMGGKVRGDTRKARRHLWSWRNVLTPSTR